MEHSTRRDPELDAWFDSLPSQFNPDKPIVEVEDPALAAVQAEYETGGELVYLVEGQRVVAWDAIREYLEGPDAQPEYAGSVALVIARMMAEWAATGEVPGLIVKKKHADPKAQAVRDVAALLARSGFGVVGVFLPE